MHDSTLSHTYSKQVRSFVHRSQGLFVWMTARRRRRHSFLMTGVFADAQLQRDITVAEAMAEQARQHQRKLELEREQQRREQERLQQLEQERQQKQLELEQQQQQERERQQQLIREHEQKQERERQHQLEHEQWEREYYELQRLSIPVTALATAVTAAAAVTTSALAGTRAAAVAGCDVTLCSLCRSVITDDQLDLACWLHDAASQCKQLFCKACWSAHLLECKTRLLPFPDMDE